MSLAVLEMLKVLEISPESEVAELLEAFEVLEFLKIFAGYFDKPRHVLDMFREIFIRSLRICRTVSIVRLCFEKF